MKQLKKSSLCIEEKLMKSGKSLVHILTQISPELSAGYIKVIDAIKICNESLKMQRKICADIYNKPPANKGNLNKHAFNKLLYNLIKNADKPEFKE